MDKLSDNLNDPDVHFIIKAIKPYPCLYDPDAQYFKNKLKRREYFVKIMKKLNKVSERKYDVENVMAINRELRELYIAFRKQRFYHFSKTRELSAPPEWWKMLYSYLKNVTTISDTLWNDTSESIHTKNRRFFALIEYYEALEDDLLLTETSSDEDQPAKKTKKS